MKYVCAAIVAFLLSAAPALAQWQTPQFSVPTGRGGGNTGFDSVAAGTAGLPFLSTGPSSKPAYGTLGIGGGGTGQTNRAAALSALMPPTTRAGDIAYFNGTQWVIIPGNNSGTACLQQSAVGVPSWGSCGGGGTVITVGASTITGGTTTRILFDNAGVVGEYIISGTGNVVMTTNPTITGPTVTGGAYSGGTFSNPIIAGATPSTTAGMLGYSGANLLFWDGSVIRTIVSLDATQTLTNKTFNCNANVCNVRLNTADVSGTLPVANGGTGGGSASGTLLDNITGFSGTGYMRRNSPGTYAFSSAASNAQYLAGSATGVPVEPSVLYQPEFTIPFGATTTIDFSQFINGAVTLTGNITTQTLANVTAGKAGTIAFIQDGTGSRTTVWSSVFKWAGGAAPTLSTTAGAVDVLSYSCRSGTFCVAALMKDAK